MTTELEVYEESETAEYTPLTERQAKALNEKIHKACDKVSFSREALWDLLNEAAQGQIHIALGTYPSWTAWFSENVRIRPLDVADRKELAIMMASRGMSTRAAAKVLDSSQKTMSRDLQGESLDSETVTSLDGSERQRSKPTEGAASTRGTQSAKDVAEELATTEADLDPETIDAEEELAEPLRPVSEDFRDEMWNLRNTVTAIKDVLEDERILVPRTRNSLATKHVNEIQDIIKELQDVIDFLMG